MSTKSSRLFGHHQGFRSGLLCSSPFLSLENVPERIPHLHLSLLHHHHLQFQNPHHAFGQDVFCYRTNMQTWILVLSARVQPAVTDVKTDQRIWYIKLMNRYDLSRENYTTNDINKSDVFPTKTSFNT